MAEKYKYIYIYIYIYNNKIENKKKSYGVKHSHCVSELDSAHQISTVAIGT
jgi:hypothetical protein